MPRRRLICKRKRQQRRYVKFKQYIPVHEEIENSNRRDIALLEHGWSPQQTKFGEPFKGKNQVLIVEEK